MNTYAFLIEQLDSEIKKFELASESHKNLHRLLRYTVFGLTALSTAIASVSIAYPEIHKPLNIAIVVITVIAGISTSIEGLRKPAELWIHERTTYYALLDLKREVEFHATRPDATFSLNEAFSRLQSILGASSDKWNRQIVGTIPSVESTTVEKPK